MQSKYVYVYLLFWLDPHGLTWPDNLIIFARSANFFLWLNFLVNGTCKRSQLQAVNVAQLLIEWEYVGKQGIGLKRLMSSTPWDAT